jgi:hypothetical protein
MDVMPDVYCCACPKPCQLSWCWSCARVWLQGSCARAFLRELKAGATMLEHWKAGPDGRPVGTVPRPG